MTLAKIARAAAAIHAKIDSFYEDLEALHADAEEYFGERSERWQEGEAGEQYREVVDALEAAVTAADECRDQLNVAEAAGG